MENKKDRETDAGKRRCVIPAEFFAEISHGKNGEDSRRYDFLDGFELSRAEFR
jgi:hypothetical protein